ncbi:hypothetical protein PGTUg99_031761 [Puccinia graminis f. sp. tritici]|uniref:Uncharacterized protein n=1 Tax=Puccinia graminis f. sp. tritici TaxID=56615 RepID=A0A5B0SDJ6_PUCGR|nr:hypothetical protein PGTUg99_031761 [Puccinia graminis f. sp. tritici]
MACWISDHRTSANVQVGIMVFESDADAKPTTSLAVRPASQVKPTAGSDPSRCAQSHFLGWGRTSWLNQINNDESMWLGTCGVPLPPWRTMLSSGPALLRHASLAVLGSGLEASIRSSHRFVRMMFCRYRHQARHAVLA